ncbi:MAG: hypothetical protein ACRCT6_13310, partial [Notoacmeibacter sp.]
FERAQVRSKSPQTVTPTASQADRRELAKRAGDFILQNVRCQNEKIIIARPQKRDFEAETFALRYLSAALGQFQYPATQSVGAKLAHLLDEGQNGLAFTAQRSKFNRIAEGILASRDERHNQKPFLNGAVSPFELFCASSLLPLANALAQTLHAPSFILPQTAAI